MQILREIFNSGWQHNWGFVPFTEHEFATMGDQLKYLVPDDMIYIAEIDSAPCAFIVGLPNINEAIADLNGSLFPFGWAKLLWRLKVSGVRTARVPLMGVRDEYQFSRIGPVIALLLIEALRDPFARRKIDALEMSWILETNTGMNNMLERIGRNRTSVTDCMKSRFDGSHPASSPAAPPSESNGGLPARYRGDSFHGPHMIACCALGNVRQPLQHRVVIRACWRSICFFLLWSMVEIIYAGKHRIKHQVGQ